MSPELNVDPDWMAAARGRLAGYHDLLATAGIERGLIGPREVPRLWSRHLENCASVADPSLGLLPPSASVVDIGTGAGLPGLVWALMREDISVTLIEPLQRRVVFLLEAVADLGVRNRVHVVTGRAQDVPSVGADVATSRALAPLPSVLRWSFPHVRPGGALLAMKGGKASQELADASSTVSEVGGIDAEVVRIGPFDDAGHPLATLVSVAKPD